MITKFIANVKEFFKSEDTISEPLNVMDAYKKWLASEPMTVTMHRTFCNNPTFNIGDYASIISRGFDVAYADMNWNAVFLLNDLTVQGNTWIKARQFDEVFKKFNHLTYIFKKDLLSWESIKVSVRDMKMEYDLSALNDIIKHSKLDYKGATVPVNVKF